MVPGQATFIPVYLLFSNLQLLNTYTALVLPGIASSFAVFLLVQFFKGIPVELEEAALLDGASRLGVYFRIFLPLSTPVLTTLAIFTFLGTWNEYLWPLVAATDQEIMTITVGLQNLTATVDRIEFGQTMAAAWAAGLPIVFFFLAFQQRIISGIQISSGIK
jgi:multiple sugar transport system permease protein